MTKGDIRIEIVNFALAMEMRMREFDKSKSGWNDVRLSNIYILNGLKRNVQQVDKNVNNTAAILDAANYLLMLLNKRIKL